MAIDPIRDAPRRQHYYFAHEYLRDRAHDHPVPLINELRKESALKYLAFHWFLQGSKVVGDQEDFIAGKGLAVFPIDMGGYYGALVQMPPPEKMVEAFFVAILLPIGETDPASVEFYTLEFTMNEERTHGTILGKWVGRSHFNLGDGPPPDKEAFLAAVEEQLA